VNLIGIRNAAKAIIIDRGKVLLNRQRDGWFTLPGGGQLQYETLEEAVRREVLEETGYSVNVRRLAAICEEISENPVSRERYPDHAHKVFFVFFCHLADKTACIPTEEDEGQLGSEWVDMGNIHNITFFPSKVKERFGEILNSEYVLFLGSDRRA